MLFPLGFLGTFLLNNFLKETYSSRKLELEESIENLLDKNVDLGDYVGIRFLGFSLGNSKINDKKENSNFIFDFLRGLNYENKNKVSELLNPINFFIWLLISIKDNF